MRPRARSAFTAERDAPAHVLTIDNRRRTPRRRTTRSARERGPGQRPTAMRHVPAPDFPDGERDGSRALSDYEGMPLRLDRDSDRQVALSRPRLSVPAGATPTPAFSQPAERGYLARDGRHLPPLDRRRAPCWRASRDGRPTTCNAFQPRALPAVRAARPPAFSGRRRPRLTTLDPAPGRRQSSSAAAPTGPRPTRPGVE